MFSRKSLDKLPIKVICNKISKDGKIAAIHTLLEH